MHNFKPKDLVAFLVIAGLILFKLTDHNGSFDVPAALIIGYYFSHRKSGVDQGI